MNKSNLFKAAHAMTKQVIKSGDNYAVTFGLCLKQIINDTKKASTMKTVTLYDEGEIYMTQHLVKGRLESFTEEYKVACKALLAKLETLQPNEALPLDDKEMVVAINAYMFLKVCYPSSFGKYEKRVFDRLEEAKG